MRMWMISPKLMCAKHLLGEHVELHMLAGCVYKAKSLDGFYEQGLLLPMQAPLRHERIVKEMESRGYTHNSKFNAKAYLWYLETYYRHKFTDGRQIDIAESIKELKKRCDACRARIMRKVVLTAQEAADLLEFPGNAEGLAALEKIRKQLK